MQWLGAGPVEPYFLTVGVVGFLGSIRVADAATGRVLDAIERAGLAESTLVAVPDE